MKAVAKHPIMNLSQAQHLVFIQTNPDTYLMVDTTKLTTKEITPVAYRIISELLNLKQDIKDLV